MTVASHLLDTNIVSHLMREPRGVIRRRLAGLADGAATISIVTLAELRFGAEKVGSERLRKGIADLVQYLPVLPFEEPADIAYAGLRAHLERIGRPIGPNDLWIAAHALVLGLTLVTANIDEFSRVPNLKLENWLD